MEEQRRHQMEINEASQTECEEPEPWTEPTPQAKQPAALCDRCGFEMFEANCKLVCPNCGSRYDCSDLTIYFD